MKYREVAYAIIPVHISGMMAPAIMVNAKSYVDAKKEAKERSTLCKRFPDQWHLI